MRASGHAGDDRPLAVFVVAVEESGDILGADLMRALGDRLRGQVRFVGVGGQRMIQAGLRALFPMKETGLQGLSAVIARLPSLALSIRRTAAAVIAANPDVLVLIDAPSFNLRVGKIVRRANPAIAIVDYVSPTVWAYFPWRARRMTPFIDQILAILPFEPAVHRDLGGPPCTFVGHPLLERLDELRPAPGERSGLAETGRPVLLVMPGSRRSEIARLMEPFGEAVALVWERFGPVEAVLPAVSSLADEIYQRAADWPVRPRIVVGEDAKLAALRRAHAALAAAG
ncbi:MAG: lipid-A-disaccharide synthase, partial [Bauldia sp.]